MIASGILAKVTLISVTFYLRSFLVTSESSSLSHSFRKEADTNRNIAFTADDRVDERITPQKRCHLPISNINNSATGAADSDNSINNINGPQNAVSTKKSAAKIAYVVMYTIFIVCTVFASALGSGLTQGLMSINPLEMSIKSRGNNETEKQQAERILPIIKRHHLLLVTIMLFNALANEAMPLFLSALVSPWLAIILSVTLVLFLGEVLPSAIFMGRYQLLIASTLAPFVWLLIALFFPIAYPISLLLDTMFGTHGQLLTVFNRSELYTMMQIQQEEGNRQGIAHDQCVHDDEVTLIGGVLTFRDVKVQDVMSHNVFSLSIDEHLTLKVLTVCMNHDTFFNI